METAPTFVLFLFVQGFFHSLCHFFWEVGGWWMVLNLFSPFCFLTFLFLHKLFHAFHLILELSVSFSNQTTFRCHWHLAAVISVDYFVSVEVWMTSQSFECNMRKWCNRTFEIQVLLVHVPTPLESPSFYLLFISFSERCFLQAEKVHERKSAQTDCVSTGSKRKQYSSNVHLSLYIESSH